MTQSREDVATPTSSLFTYVSHFSFSKRNVPARLCRPPRRMPAMPHISFILNSPLLSLLVSSSPMLLFLHSQVASRVRAGFVGAHARWRDTVTDLIVRRREREKETKADTIREHCLCCSWFPRLFCSKYIHKTHYSYVVAYWRWFDIVRRRMLNYQDVWNNILSLDVKIEKLQQSRGQRHKTHRSREEVQFHQSCCVTEALQQQQNNCG